MNDKARSILIKAVQAGMYGVAVEPSIAQALASGSRKLTLAQLDFDSLAWMEFCISVELLTGQELTPADVEGMSHTFQIEEWLRTRL
jgi:hypothetical protein